MKKPSLLVIFLTVVIDLIGFGIVLPVLPQVGLDLHAAGWQTGLIVASFSLMQFLFAPAWGRLSDRIGRRPVLLVSTAGAVISYALFALAITRQSLGLLLISRLFAGICGANLSVASAYIADISKPEERSRRMGLVGMAFGIGFILGPLLGALSAHWWGAAAPGWVASGICGANLILAYFILGESHRPESAQAEPRPRVDQWLHVLRRPQLRVLVGLFFFATFCFTCFESGFVVLFVNNPKMQRVERVAVPHGATVIWQANNGTEVKQGDVLGHAVAGTQPSPIRAPRSGRVEATADGGRAINHTMTTAYYLMAFCGLVGAVVQGGMIGRLVKLFGEKRLIGLGLLLLGTSLFLLPQLTHIGWLMAGLALFALASGVYRAPTFGLISLNASPREQGEVLGVTQSVGSLARIVGPVFVLGLFDIRPELPYFICACIAALAGWVALVKLNQPRIPAAQAAGAVPAAGKAAG